VLTHTIKIQEVRAMTTSLPTLSPTRDVDAIELPSPGVWRVDPGHAEVGFVGRHLVFTKVRGRFRDISGVIRVAEDPNATTVAVEIDMASVESGSDQRDEHLRSEDLFDVDRHPTATFRGSASDWTGRTGKLAGDLTIKGVTRPVVLDVEYHGFVRDPWGGDRIVFSASTTINREDWGVTWNMPLEAGGLLVSKEIRIELEIEATRVDP
jgi:polyisoprenoid-binding protein YceI